MDVLNIGEKLEDKREFEVTFKDGNALSMFLTYVYACIHIHIMFFAPSLSFTI